MNEPMGTPAPAPEAPKKSNTGLIIAIVVVVVLCCCCALGVALWQYGDQLVRMLG